MNTVPRQAHTISIGNFPKAFSHCLCVSSFDESIRAILHISVRLRVNSPLGSEPKS